MWNEKTEDIAATALLISVVVLTAAHIQKKRNRRQSNGGGSFNHMCDSRSARQVRYTTVEGRRVDPLRQQ